MVLTLPTKELSLLFRELTPSDPDLYRSYQGIGGRLDRISFSGLTQQNGHNGAAPGLTLTCPDKLYLSLRHTYASQKQNKPHAKYFSRGGQLPENFYNLLLAHFGPDVSAVPPDGFEE